jgi:3-oxoacyl-[acyl-carrier protein] reductase
MHLGLTDKVALVTGASAGLGLAVARELSREGARVAIVARRRDELTRQAEVISKETGNAVVPIPADVTGDGAARLVARLVAEQLGPLDILVANAGGPPSTTSDTTTLEQYRAALELSLLASIQLAIAVVPGMRSRRWGRVIFLSSMAAKQPLAGLMLSNTARSGLLGFAKTLANEAARDNVLVNTVLPGHFDTARAGELARMRAEREGRSVDEILAARTTSIPLGRVGEPAEMGAVVAFLASERASFITGTALQVDGGQIQSIY